VALLFWRTLLLPRSVKMARAAGALVLAAVLCFFAAMPGFTSPLSTRSGFGRSQSLLPRHAAAYENIVYGTPLDVFSAALAEAASATKEAVPVMQDMLYLKAMFESEEANKGKDKWFDLVNVPKITLVQRAEQFVDFMKDDLKSTAVPKFIVFLAKKRRLDILRPLTLRYVKNMYELQSIVPMQVESAAPMSEAQIKNLKEQMKKKLGVQDIKVISKIDPALVAGFKLYWDYEDPEKLKNPQMFLDASFQTHLQSAALSNGVDM